MNEQTISIPQFMSACMTGKLKVVNAYIKQGGDINVIYSKARLSAPMVAGMFNQPEVMALLANNNADFLYTTANGKNAVSFCMKGSECQKIAIDKFYIQMVEKETKLKKEEF